MLGTFSQGMKLNSFLPLPPSPYYALSINSTLHQLKEIKGVDYYCPKEDCTSQLNSGTWKLENRPLSRQKPTVFNQSGKKNKEEVPSGLVRDGCRLDYHLEGILDTTDFEIEGLELSDYLST